MILLIIYILSSIATALSLTFFVNSNPLFIVLWVIAGFGINMLIFVIWLYGLVLPILSKIKPTNKVKHFIAAQVMTFILTLMRTSYSVKNKENIMKAEGRPLVIVANHKCTLDVIWVYLAMKQPMTGIAKSTLGKNMWYRPIIKAFDVVLLNRESDREAAKSILKGVKLIEEGLPILIFTEGAIRTRETEQMVCFRPGAYKLATKPNASIQPIVVRNSHTMHNRRFLFSWTHVTMEVLPVVTPDDYKDMSTTDLGFDIAKKINSHFDEEQVEVEVMLKL